MNRLLLLLFVLGAIVAAVSQLFTPTGWWLNSGSGVRTTAIVLVALAGVVAYGLPRVAGNGAGAPAERVSSVVSIMVLWCGVMAGLAGTLFAIGPGSIFPIVLVFAAVLSAMPVAVGAAAGLGLRSLTRRAPL